MNNCIPKSKLPLAEMLLELRDWASLEYRVEEDSGKKKIWRDVVDWATGAAIQSKINLETVPLALKKHTANEGTVSEKGAQ